MLGDGGVYTNSDGGNPFLFVNMITPEYLNYLSEMFSYLSTEPKLRKTAEQSAEETRKASLTGTADKEKHSDVYHWRVSANPELERWLKWYESGEKVFPENVKLTPTTLKHWYCGDGDFHVESGRARISLSNERDNKKKIMDMFERAGFEDFTWCRSKSRGDYADSVRITFNKEGTKWFFRYIGNPLPGFEYKWPDDYTHQSNVQAVN